ncbi:MAG TPA: efflux RND transporter periplasmic adaptor subunit, partial [Pseudomonadales bacterium]|nr:efflux RND transporter periplasmic adaptor subunit [Pseudomonadales bacterium]
AQENLAQAEINLKQAERQNRYIQKLSKEKNVSQDQLDTAGETLALRRSQMQAARLQLKSVQANGQDYLQAEAEFSQAKAALDLAQAKLNFSKILAPRSGVIMQRKVEPGQVVQSSSVMFVMVPTDHPEITLPIDEKNLSFVHVGQRAKVTADAFPGDVFDARVKKLAPSVDAERGAVDVTLTVENPPDYLREDMTVSAEIIVADKDAALLIGSAAVREPDTVAPWVWRVVDNTIEKTQIKIGARESGFTEVLSGLNENDLVVAGSAEALVQGQHVRTQEAKP